MRRGDYRNYYKGHMDKTKGEGGGGEGGGFSWGGVEGWGEKAYNCNSITIKKKSLKKDVSTLSLRRPCIHSSVNVSIRSNQDIQQRRKPTLEIYFPNGQRKQDDWRQLKNFSVLASAAHILKLERYRED